MLQEVGDDPSDEKVKEFVLNTLKGGVNINIVFFLVLFFFQEMFVNPKPRSKVVNMHCLLIKMARFCH